MESQTSPADPNQPLVTDVKTSVPGDSAPPAGIDVTTETPPAGAAGVAATEPLASGGIEEGSLLDALRQVIDPELMINVVDLGLVYSVVAEESKVKVEMTLTSPACPAGPQIVQQSKSALERVAGVSEAEIRLVLSPPWTPERMTDEARDQLGIF
ncbi:MAG: metal-sulfur cluster assembly factor [Planctomycetaceae bacterium]|nr:MAG: metal-sulfur cluster assembly factor [Planctomycetaceae bacterium]